MPVVAQAETLVPRNPGEDYIGRARATEKVEIRARASGVLAERRFLEGSCVAPGDILFQIDQFPFPALVERRRAGGAIHGASRGRHGRCSDDRTTH